MIYRKKYKICLVTNFSNSPSTVLNKSLLSVIPGFEFHETLNDVSNLVDIILFMGYDPQVEEAKRLFPKAKVGIIDPRPNMDKDLDIADFWLANGVEMLNYFIAINSNSFIYPIYPLLSKKKEVNYSYKNDLVIGYHGNRDHLELMKASVCPALERLSKDFNITLKCIYNVKQLGDFSWKPLSENIKLEFIQWTYDAYEKHFNDTSIGIVPNLIPFKPNDSEFDLVWKNQKLSNDFDLKYRFKPTSNMGRILVFAQLGIPVISDMFPSSAEVIKHGINGLLAVDEDSWYAHLNYLAKNASERKRLAENMTQVFRNQYHWKHKNVELLQFIEKVCNGKQLHSNNLLARLKSMIL